LKSGVGGKILVIVAPSGTGKSTLIAKLKEDFPQMVESVSHTTRSPRKGEEDGVHYFFTERESFKGLIEEGAFIEWAEVHNNFYGTSKKFIDSTLKEGLSLIFDLDVQGADSFKRYFGNMANVIFISPPSIEALEQRLKARATDLEEVIKVRLENAKREILRKDDFDYCLINDNFENAYRELKKIVEEILGD
tara:strand:+ start:32 stop:607 length:576 start_codon:yes stop_codon:yes gene_type:complete